MIPWVDAGLYQWADEVRRDESLLFPRITAFCNAGMPQPYPRPIEFSRAAMAYDQAVAQITGERRHCVLLRYLLHGRYPTTERQARCLKLSPRTFARRIDEAHDGIAYRLVSDPVTAHVVVDRHTVFALC